MTLLCKLGYFHGYGYGEVRLVSLIFLPTNKKITIITKLNFLFS